MLPRPWFNSLLPLFFCLCCLLTGCVNYDVGINFAEQHRGEIVQHITLGEQLTTLSQTEADRWLESLELRAKALQGKVVRRSDQELTVTIPFGNGQELVDKFNQFFNPDPPKSRRQSGLDQLDLLNLKAELALEQHNWLLLDRNRLALTVDLRALGVLSNQGNIILSPGSLIDLQFALQTPLGIKLLATDAPNVPDRLPDGAWQLKPGQINTLEAIFWVPSYLAIGTVAIIALGLGGFFFKYRRWPGVLPS